MNWIDVKTKLPNEGISVLVVAEKNIWIMKYDTVSGWQCPQEGWSMNVTHWMELPTAPNA
jgi:hypothetical protein